MDKQKTVVLLHGFGEDSSIFNKQVEILSDNYHVLAPDLPGSGTLSDHEWLNGTETIEWLARWINEELAKKGIEKCILLGHSMGGYITLAFAEMFPDKLEGFGLIHSTAFADTEQKKETRKKAIAFMEEKGGFVFLKTAIPGLFGERFAKSNPEAIESLVSKASDFREDSLIAYYKAMIERPDRTHVLKNSKVPVLIVAGTHDMAAPLEDLSRQAAFPAVCHFHILKETGHMGMLEDGQNLCMILLNYLAAI